MWWCFPWLLEIGLGPIFKRHHWPALAIAAAADADAAASAGCGYSLKIAVGTKVLQCNGRHPSLAKVTYTDWFWGIYLFMSDMEFDSKLMKGFSEHLSKELFLCFGVV